jgi:tetratricopeptide (TPR) repeat protein
MRSRIRLSAGFCALLLLGTSSSGALVQPEKVQPAVGIDPTLAGRLACKGNAMGGAILSARLTSAAQFAAKQRDTAVPGLYRDIAPSDLPTGNMAAEARPYFDQGLALAYGFNHAGAIRSFRRARELDPGCAMCWWGEAMANGPNINAGLDDGQNKAALAALASARELAGAADPAVGALIDAQAARFSPDHGASRASLDFDYAEAMLVIARANPSSDDLAVLAAEAAMTTSPWNYWESPAGTPRPLIAVSLIEKVMARNPRHPKASHLYIHLLELPDPRKAEAAADRLHRSGPRALGHLVHMPAHIYYRLGRYVDSMEANIEAVAADEAYLREVGDDGLVRYGYYPHNVHFLLTSAQMLGDVQTVVTQTARLESILDVETGRELYWVQAIYAAPYFAYAQYASPEAVLALTDRPHPLAFVDAMRNYARAVASAEAGKADIFEQELDALLSRSDDASVLDMEANGFPAPLIIRLAGQVAEGRRAMAERRYRDAIRHFEQAAEMQRAIPYNEPPFWYYPVSQSLGAAHYKAGNYDEARTAFRAALFDAPNSALALYGLKETERRLGNQADFLAAQRAFEQVWRGEDAWLDMGRI